MPSGASQKFTITAAQSYRVAGVLVDGASAGAVSTYTFTNVQAPHTISASFTPDVFTITATAGSGGSISPAGTTTLARGAGKTYTITPDQGFKVRRVVVDGAYKGGMTTYTFTDVMANHSIDVSFMPL